MQAAAAASCACRADATCAGCSIWSRRCAVRASCSPARSSSRHRNRCCCAGGAAGSRSTSTMPFTCVARVRRGCRRASPRGVAGSLGDGWGHGPRDRGQRDACRRCAHRTRAASSSSRHRWTSIGIEHEEWLDRAPADARLGGTCGEPRLSRAPATRDPESCAPLAGAAATRDLFGVSGVVRRRIERVPWSARSESRRSRDGGHRSDAALGIRPWTARQVRIQVAPVRRRVATVRRVRRRRESGSRDRWSEWVSVPAGASWSRPCEGCSSRPSCASTSARAAAIHVASHYAADVVSARCAGLLTDLAD